MSSTLFEMALLHAINDFTNERDRMLYKEGPQNRSETLELSPRVFQALVNLIKDIPMESLEQPNISVGTGVTEKDGEGVGKHSVDRNVLSEINSMLEKIYLDANWTKIINNTSSVHLLPENVTTTESSITETQPTSKEIILVGVADMGNRDANTSQAQSGNLMKQGVTESAPESTAHEGESGPNYLATQLAKEINRYLQNVSPANETVKMINTSYLHGHGQRFSELLAKLNKVIATAPKVLGVDKKEDLPASESILLKILTLSNTVLQDLNDRMSVNASHETANAEPDKHLLMKSELIDRLSKQKEFDQINHFVQMFYKLEENLSNLKLFLETYKKGKNRKMAERLLDQSLSLVGLLGQIPWLNGKNPFIDFELEALRDFAGVLSDIGFKQHEPSVGST